VLGAVIAGILAGQAEGAGRAGAAVLVAPLGIATAALARRRAARVVVAVLAFGLLGAAVTQRALHGLVRSPLAHPVAELADVSLRGTLVEDPAESRWETRVLVRARAFREIHGGWRDAGGRRVLVEGSGDAAVPLRVLEAGDGVTLDGWLGPLEGFDAQDRWRHAVGVLHTSALVALRDPTSPLQRVAEDARGLVLAGAGRLAPVDRALLGGFLVGDTRGLPDALVEQFRDAGLTHLLVVSGENVAFVLALFAPLLRRLGLRGRLVGGLAVLVLFGTMTRWEPSVLRAVAMAAIALVAGFLGRPTEGLRTLVLAATVLLLADPFLLHSVGFGLSCGASLGIAVLARPLARRLPGPAFLRDTLSVTTAAQLGVAPVLIPVFGSIPLVALPANLVAMPLAAPLTMCGLAGSVVGGLVGRHATQLAGALLLPSVALLRALTGIARVAAQVPVAVDGRSVWAIAGLCALATSARLARNLRRDGRADVAVPAG
jgi:competence protein ComEC